MDAFKNLCRIVESLDSRLLVLVVLFVGFFNSFVFDLVLGYGVMSNDSLFYLNHANQILETGYSHLIESVPFYYWMLPVFLSGMKSIFAENWVLAFTVVQCFFYGCFCAFGFALSNQMFGRLSAFVTLFFCLISYELLSWTRYILTDVVFATAVMALLFVFLRLEKTKWRDPFSWILTVFLCFLVFVARPIGFLIPGSLMLYVGFKYRRLLNQKAWCVLGVCFAIACLVSSALLWLVWEDYDLQRYFAAFGRFYESGVIIKHRPFYALPEVWFDAQNFIVWRWLSTLLLVVIRFFSFWNPFIVGYSIEHLFINLFTLFPVFCLVVFGFKKVFSQQESALYWIIFFVTLFHSLTLIDFDHRYRIPVLGMAFVLAGGVFSSKKV